MTELLGAPGSNGFGAIISFVAAWFVTQSIKFTIAVHEKGLREAFSLSSKPGGMPSGHTAGFVAITTFLALAEGLDSSIFGLAVAVTIVIMYDALHVRFAVGELGETVKKLAHKVDPKMSTPRIMKGHKLTEVLAGLVLGLAIGFAVYLLI